jgi:hypothetical protein
MEKEVREKIQEITDGINCLKDFKCAKDGFEHLCKATDTPLKIGTKQEE